jgi:hypothetical protein
MELCSVTFVTPINKTMNKTMRLILTLAISCILCVWVSFKSYGDNNEEFSTHLNSEATQSIIFYYNKVDSINELVNFDRVVLEPSLVTDRQIRTLHKADSLVFAYLSVGELSHPDVPLELNQSVLFTNQDWQSKIMDLSSLAWQKYLSEKAESFVARGFDGVFLDTLDSFELVPENIADHATQQSALVNIINNIQSLHTPQKLILNRGFDIVEDLQVKPYALLAESMFHSYSPSSESYNQVSQADTLWLQNKLDAIKQLNVETIVLDYLPADKQLAQIEAAKHLLLKGHTPYISDGMLYEIGVSTVAPVSRRVLGFYNGKRQALVESQCHRMLSMPLEYFGYIPDCQDIHKFNFEAPSLHKYAAITFWLNNNDYAQVPQLDKLITDAYETLPMLFLSAFPSNPIIQELLGLSSGNSLTLPVKQVKGELWTQAFKQAHFSEFELADEWLVSSPALNQEIIFEDSNAQLSSFVVSAAWGGAALDPYPIKLLPNQKVAWMLDPFTLIRKTLKLPAIPVSDITTESGRKVMISYVDGDGFPSKSSFPGNPYTAEVLRDEIFKKFELPHTISVIQAEIYKGGLYPKQSDTLEDIARSIYKIPHVELASHTYSHPFFWRETTVTEKLYGDHLPVKGYEVDYKKEILGSIDYINSTLAPRGKKANLILWSGAANPTEEILQISERNNILNINGGSTFVVNGDDDLTQVSPHIVSHPSAVQVYAPIMNENLYTNLWTEHYDGFARVIQTYNLLENPRRLKPISIYYHMYSGQFPASVKALTQVYDWVLTQSINPMFLSEYASRARTLYDTGIAKTLDGRWQVSSTGITSMRLPHELGYPYGEDLVGYNDIHDGKYLTFKQAKTVFGIADTPKDSTFLVSSNGQISQWQNSRAHVSWAVFTHVPMEIDIQFASGVSVDTCQVNANKTVSIVIAGSNRLKLSSKQTGSIQGTIECKTRFEQGQRR